jgi:hypothetical protein
MFPDMKVTSLLIIWLFPLLQAGGHGQSLCRGGTGTPHAEAHATSSVIQNARDVFFRDNPSSGSLRASLEDDEEDSLKDGSFDTGLLLSRSSPDFGQGDLSFLAHSRHDLLRIPFHAHPLLC